MMYLVQLGCGISAALTFALLGSLFLGYVTKEDERLYAVGGWFGALLGLSVGLNFWRIWCALTIVSLVFVVYLLLFEAEVTQPSPRST